VRRLQEPGSYVRRAAAGMHPAITAPNWRLGWFPYTRRSEARSRTNNLSTRPATCWCGAASQHSRRVRSTVRASVRCYMIVQASWTTASVEGAAPARMNGSGLNTTSRRSPPNLDQPARTQAGLKRRRYPPYA
jgi:hypothetical protein